MRKALRTLSFSAALLAGCAGAPSTPVDSPAVVVDTARLMEDVRVLAADSMEGRRTGTPGVERARRYLLHRFGEVGLRAFPGGFAREFTFGATPEARLRGVNVVGYLPGREEGGPVLVVTAHYDHLGIQNGQIYNGADDNASGTAALLALAWHFAKNPPEHMLVLAALDAEELGLRGARAFLEDPPVEASRIALNVNLDMVGRNDRGELFTAGTHHYPFLRPYLERAADGASISLRFGHDSPDLGPADDWTLLSDHGAFHAEGIPFVYFGVEDHQDYHRPTDDVERIHPAFYAGAVGVVIRAVEELEGMLSVEF